MHKNRVSIVALTVLILGQLPLSAVAAEACTVSAQDTVAGLGTEVSVSFCAGRATGSLSLRSPSGTVYTQELSLDASGNAITLIPSSYTQTAGRYDISVAGASGTFMVIADRADAKRSTVTASPTHIRGNGQDTTTVTAIVRDRFDNPVAGRPIALISSRASDDISGLSAETDKDGRMLWSVRATESGPMTLIPYDVISAQQLQRRADVFVTGESTYTLRASVGSFGGDPVTADLTSSTVDHFELSLPQNVTNVNANELFSMTVRAMNGTSLVRGYIGTLIVESSDPDAELPKKGEDPNNPHAGRIDMRSVDQGERKLSLIFVLGKQGAQTITVYDKLDPSIRGTITLNVNRGNNAGNEQIVILDPLDRSRIKGETVLLQGHAPSFIDLTIRGGAQIVNASTDAEGVFRANVPLNPANKEVTLFVTSENGTMESEPVHLIIDTEAPEIETITFDPVEGKTEQATVMTVQSESGLSSMTADLDGTLLAFTEENGIYTSAFTAPKEAGTYDIKITATDSVGNATTMLTKWTVKPRQMPVVTGVAAESLPQKVALTWNKIDTAAVAEYKIYIALEKDPQNYLHSISTKKPVTSAVIEDLPLGETYLFSLTAISPDGEESAKKSDPVRAVAIGIHFAATSGKDSLLLEWNSLKDLPLDHYILEYGTSQSELSEKRSINGKANSFMLRDLLRGITYELRLTPVTVTGEKRTDLAAYARGTPNGNGFTPGTDDPIPPNLHSGANLYPPPSVPHVPQTPGSGIPSMVGSILFLVTIITGFLWRSHAKQRKLTQQFLSMMQERYHS